MSYTNPIKDEANRLGCNIEDEDFAQKMDDADVLKSFKEQFHFPKVKDICKCEEQKQNESSVIYMTGNSLGLQPKAVRGEIESYLADWQRYAVEGHHKGAHPWISIDEEIQESLSHVVGANRSEVCPMNTLSVNLHVMMSNFYKPTQQRHKIVIEAGAFPSDLYIAESQIRNNGFNPETSLIKLEPYENQHTLTTEQIKETLSKHGDSIALIMIGGVQFFTGQLFDIKEITAFGQSLGAVVGWDLAHAAGNVELHLHDWNVDFACWCSYKYLNSGPGCIGGLFVHERHTKSFEVNNDHRLMGWFGNKLANRFKKETIFEAEEGALGFRCSNPSVADCTSLRTSLAIINLASIQALRSKSLLLTSYLENLLLAIKGDNSFSIITPRDPAQRGAQLSLFITGQVSAVKLKVSLLNQGIVCDVREPNVIRVSPAPLYTSFTDVKNFVNILISSLNEK